MLDNVVVLMLFEQSYKWTHAGRQGYALIIWAHLFGTFRLRSPQHKSPVSLALRQHSPMHSQLRPQWSPFPNNSDTSIGIISAAEP